MEFAVSEAAIGCEARATTSSSHSYKASGKKLNRYKPFLKVLKFNGFGYFFVLLNRYN